MNKILFTVFISLSVVNVVCAQESKLHLIMAHPFYDAEPFPSYLFRLNTTNNSLDTLLQLSTGKEALREVKYYPEQKKIIFVKDGWFLTENTHKVIQFLNMDESHKLESINLDSLNYGYNNSWLFNQPSSKSGIFGVELYNSKLLKKRVLLGVDIGNLHIKEFDTEAFKYTEISGNTGSCLLTFDGLPAYTNSKNGELRIPESSDTAKRPVFSIQLPKEFRFGKKERRSIVINDSSAFAFSLNNSQTSQNNLGFTDLAILDKSTKKWFKQRIKGNSDNMIRSFNGWIVGTVYSDNKIFDENGRLKDKIKRISPGKDKRRQKISRSGMPADYRYDYFSVYSPGILYLINVRTRDYLEWNTGQGDSEILLVENNEVYYRVNDGIYKAQILNGKKLNKAQLIIRSEIVPDIHWVFISK